MATTAIDRGLLSRPWPRSPLDVTASGQDKVEQPCNILLKLGWQPETSRQAKTRFSEANVPTPPNGQFLADAGTEGPEPSKACTSSCGEADLLVGLFKAISIKDYDDSLVNTSTRPFQSGFPSNAYRAKLGPLCLPSDKIVSRPRLTMAYGEDTSKRLGRRHCHSESDLSPEIEFSNRSLRESVRDFFSLITLSSCFEAAGSKSTSFFADDSPDMQTSVTVEGAELGGEQDADTESLPSSPGAATLIGEQPSVSQQQQLNPKSLLDEPLPLAHVGFSLQDDSLDEKETSYSPQSTVSNQSSSAKLTKSVSFADDLGKSLTEVFEFDSTADSVPDDYTDIYDEHYDRTLYGVLRRPKWDDRFTRGRFTRSRNRSRVSNCFGDYCFASDCPDLGRYSPPDTRPAPSPPEKQPPVYVWNINFQQPATKYYEFRQKVENNAVSLENISVANPEPTRSDQLLPNLSGTVKVLNMAYHKQVWLRVTVDSWQTFTEHQANYSRLLSGGHLQTRFDTFTFQISSSQLLEPLAVSPDRIKDVCRIEFAIRYTVDGGGRQYWDNNEGKNYVIERSQRTADSFNLNSQWGTTAPPSSRSDNHTSYCFSDYRTTIDDITDPYTAEYLPNFSGVTSFTDYRVWNHFADENVYY